MVKRQEEAKKGEELKFNGRLGKLRTQIIKNLSKE
jgi:hypothetical protein